MLLQILRFYRCYHIMEIVVKATVKSAREKYYRLRMIHQQTGEG